jgi:pyridoxine kinase
LLTATSYSDFMPILSVQSHVAYGHVGNDAAVFPLQRLGHEVWAVHTVQFAAHTGYGPPKGQVFEASHIRDVIDGIALRDDFASCEAVLSGYMGSAAIGEAILDAVQRVNAVNPDALYVCDPVLGDVGKGFFVRPEMPDFMRDYVVPKADIVTPNLFELEALTGMTCATLDDTKYALQMLHDKGPRMIVLTSAVIDETPADAIDMLASDANGLWRVRTSRLGFSPNGAGDLTASLFTAHYLRTRSVSLALAMVASSVHAVLQQTLQKGGGELALIAAQDCFVAPPIIFQPEAL